MQNPTTVSLSRMLTMQQAIEVTATNVANANTPGYKAERLQFSDWLTRQTGTLSPPGGNVIAATQLRATYRDQGEGAISQTSNPLDVAIAGPGYFTVAAPSGPRLTRAGHFGLAPDGTIVDGSGNALLDTNGQPLQVGTADAHIAVATDGTLSTENGQIGKIGIVQPQDPLRLTAEGNHLFNTTSPTDQVSGTRLVQGAIEQSNVEPVTEMTRLLTMQRQFQAAADLAQEEFTRQQSAIDQIKPPVV